MNQATSALLMTFMVGLLVVAAVAIQLAREGRLGGRRLPMLALIVLVPTTIGVTFAVQSAIGPSALALILLVLGGFLLVGDRASLPVEPQAVRRIALMFIASGVLVLLGGSIISALPR